MAWYVFGQNIQAISRAAGNSPSARADLVTYLLGRELLDDALGQWDGLSAADKIEQRTVGLSLMGALLNARRFHAAFKVYHDIDASGGAGGTRPEQVSNGGFEGDVGLSDERPFDWYVHSVPQAQIGIDERYRRSGNRSLRIRFQAPAQLDFFKSVGQLVVVEPSTAYRLEFYVRAADLKSASMPFIAILDGADATTVLASSAPLQPGTTEWQPVTLDFKTGPKTEAISIVSSRSACDSDTPCPIFGIVWYDDFNLQRSGGAGAAAEDATVPQGRRADAGRDPKHAAR
jgi:hypothetical protein